MPSNAPILSSSLALLSWYLSTDNAPQANTRKRCVFTYLVSNTGCSFREPAQSCTPMHVWESIDMEEHGMAYTLLMVLKRMAISRMTHGWLNTGTQRAKIARNASSNCPSCGQSNKTQGNILHCKAPRMRKERHYGGSTLRSTILTKLGSSTTWAVLFQGRQKWLDGEDKVLRILTKAAGKRSCKNFTSSY